MWAEMVILKYNCNPPPPKKKKNQKQKNMYVIIHSIFTSCYPQYSHDPDDGGVDRQSSTDLNFFQRDAHQWQEHYGQIQLVPPSTSSHVHSHVVE